MARQQMMPGGLAALAFALSVSAASLLAPGRAEAAWIKAETSHFIVYGDGDPKVVRDYATNLTIYDQALRAMHPGVQDRPDVQKVTVYLAKDEAEFRHAIPDSYGIAGLYHAGPQSVVAVAWLTKDAGGPQIVLFHEYAHHFMLENFPSGYPTWFTEGWAEYFSTTEITPQGALVGSFQKMRMAWLLSHQWITMRALLTGDTSLFQGADPLLFYSEAWFFIHYMKDNPQRAAQLDKAMLETVKGADPVEAMEKATGKSLTELRAELRDYKTLQTLLVPAKMLDMHPQVTITTLPPSADELLLDEVRLELAEPANGDDGVVGAVRRRAARYRGDRFADLVLARAEFTFGDVAAGEAIVRRRLAENPADPEFLPLAGLGEMMAGERDPAQRIARFRAARPYLIKAYAADNSDFRILYHYALSRSVEADYPDENDLNAALTAHALAPDVSEASLLAATALIRKGRRSEATGMLTVVANNPHGGAERDAAKALLAGKSEAEAETILERGKAARR